MFSYWEQTSFTQYDFIVLGAGIVGLSTAIELRTKHPQASILVLERGLMTTGASSRNAGFACIGSLTELLDDLQTMSEFEVATLLQQRHEGLQLLRERLGDQTIDYREEGSYEILNAANINALDALEKINRLLREVLPGEAFTQVSATGFGFAPNFCEAIVQNNFEGSLHTGKMLRALHDYALQTRIEIKTGAEVLSFTEDEDRVQVHVADALRSASWDFSCTHLFVCTNAFAKRFFESEDITPGRGQILLTAPLPDLPFKGIFHFDSGYGYFRNLEGRILFGGYRNLDFAGETTHEFGLNERIQQQLEDTLWSAVLPGRRIEIAQRWSGIMAFGKTKQPIVKAFGKRVFGAFRMGGMGVAVGSYCAKHLVHDIFTPGLD